MFDSSEIQAISLMYCNRAVRARGMAIKTIAPGINKHLREAPLIRCDHRSVSFIAFSRLHVVAPSATGATASPARTSDRHWSRQSGR